MQRLHQLLENARDDSASVEPACLTVVTLPQGLQGFPSLPLPCRMYSGGDIGGLEYGVNTFTNLRGVRRPGTNRLISGMRFFQVCLPRIMSLARTCHACASRAPPIPSKSGRNLA